MKTKFTLKGLEFGGIKIGEIQTEMDFSIREIKAVKDLAFEVISQVLDNSEDYLEKAALLAMKYSDLKDQVDKYDFLKELDVARERISKAGSLEELDNICKHYYSICPSEMSQEIDDLHNQRYHELRVYSDDKIEELKKKIESSTTIVGVMRLTNTVKSEVIPDKYKKELLALLEKKHSEILFNYSNFVE